MNGPETANDRIPYRDGSVTFVQVLPGRKIASSNEVRGGRQAGVAHPEASAVRRVERDAAHGHLRGRPEGGPSSSRLTAPGREGTAARPDSAP